MTDALQLLEALKKATEALPAFDAEPEAVLTAADVLMQTRESTFAQLEALVKDGLQVTPEMRATAASLGAFEQAWSARMHEAMSTTAQRLTAHRKLSLVKSAYGVPQATSRIQI